tara:strand:+ start:4339 stop:5094 length:756 start_codon:yes stop_codon:yes gene_type:complete
LLDFENVSYVINKKSINSNISFSIKQGDLISIIGPNGSGKSTILKLMAGEIIPTSGNIIFKNKNISNWNNMDLACHRAILSQTNNLSFPFTVTDIIKMGRYPFNQNNYNEINKDNHIINKMINYFDLIEYSNRNYLTLSGGEKQRVQLARVFAQIWSKDAYSGKIILLDEPNSYLDINHQIRLFKLIKKLNKKGLTIIMVLHQINQAFLNCKKIMMLKKSTLKYFGDVKKTLNKKNIKEIFNVDYTDAIKN